MISIMETVSYILKFKKNARKACFLLFSAILFLPVTSSANNLLDLGCLINYQAWLKPTDSLEVSAMPAPIKIKMAGVKTFSGEVPQGCGGHIPAGTQAKIFTVDNRLYSLDFLIKTKKPYFSQFITSKELSKMEASLRHGNYAVSDFSTNLDKGTRMGYQVEIVSGGFLERLIYKSPELAKYE